MVCDNYVAHAFKPDVCRECGMKKALHTNLPAAASTSTPSPLVKLTTPPTSTPITAARVAPVAVIKPTSLASTISNGNGVAKPLAAASALSTATVSKPVSSASSSSSSSSTTAATASPVRAIAAAAPLNAQSSTVQPSASSSTPGKSSKACDTFTAHSFFPNKCRECQQPKADHAASAIATATAVSATSASTINNSAASSPALKTTPVKFASPFKSPTVPTTSAATTSAGDSTTAPVTTASTASTSIKQRLASLGGGFNPLMMNQSPPAVSAPSPSVDVAGLSSAINESMGSPASAVRKPSISVPRRQPSATSLPQFSSTGQSSPSDLAAEAEVGSEEAQAAHEEQQQQVGGEAEVRSEEAKAAEEEQQQQVDKEALLKNNTSPALSAAAPHAHVIVPVADSITTALFSPTSAAAATEPTVESKAGALIGSSKNADMWDEEDSSKSEPTPPLFISDSIVSTPSTSSLPTSTAAPQPASTSATDPESTVSSVSSYLARQKVTTIPVVSSTSSSLFGDDWDDVDDDVPASKSTVVAPTKAAAPVREKRALFDDDVEMDKEDELFRAPLVVPATHATQPSPAVAAPSAASTAAVTPTLAAANTSTSSDPLSAPSSTSDVSAASVSAADFYAKQAETESTTTPTLPASKPALPPRVSSSVFFKPGQTVSTTSTPATPSSASASSASPSSRPSPSSTQKQGVFFKVNSLGFEQKVSDAVTVVPVSQGRVSELPKPAATSTTGSTSKLPDYVDDAKGKHTSTVVSPATSSVTSPKKSNLFDDDDVDDSQLFTHTTTTTTHPNATAASHPLGVVGAVQEVKRPAGELFGDEEEEDVVRPPAVLKQHSNVFDNDGFAGF